MLSSLTSGVSGLENFQQQMDVIGNNIANINTAGYKASVVDFADAFSNTYRTGTGGSGTTSGPSTIQVGTGVTITGINNNWSQGSVSANGVPSNLAITGNGFFMVKDTVTGDTYATRVGAFSVDPNGYLVTDNGERVQGYSDSGLSALGDIKIDLTGSPSTTASMVGYTIDTQGKVNVQLSDGTSFVRGQVLMQNFQDPSMLVNVGGNLYTNLSAAGQLPGLSAAGTNGLGTMKSGALELSNVDLSNEMANLITAQRAFEANSKIITTSDEALQVAVNMIH